MKKVKKAKELLVVELARHVNVLDERDINLEKYNEDQLDELAYECAKEFLDYGWKKIDKQSFERLSRVFARFNSKYNNYTLQDKIFYGSKPTLKEYNMVDEQSNESYAACVVININDFEIPRVECYLNGLLYNFQNFSSMDDLADALEVELEEDVIFENLVLDKDMIKKNTFHELIAPFKLKLQ